MTEYIRDRLARTREGNDYVCYFDGRWRCGKCMRGVYRPGELCRVCGAVHWYRDVPRG